MAGGEARAELGWRAAAEVGVGEERLDEVRGFRAELPRRLAVVGMSGSAGNRGGGAPAALQSKESGGG